MSSTSPFASRLLLIAAQMRLSKLLREHYDGLEVTSVPTYMAGVAELANGPVRGIVAEVPPRFVRLQEAVRALRRAAGRTTPLVLLCDPEAEPLAQQALSAGASNYLISPPPLKELDEMLSLGSAVPICPETPAQSLLETRKLGEVLQYMTSDPQRMLDCCAELLTLAVPARSATVLADGGKGHFGESDQEDMLREPIVRDRQMIGAVLLGPPTRGSYTRAHLDKLHHYAELFGHIFHTTRRHHHWHQLALTDDVTSLPNRRYVMQFLDRILERAACERFRVTVCMFDIDDFKRYNDEFGHAAGDQVIRATGSLLRRHCRAEDVVARYGGDEFVVVFWDAEEPRQAGSQHPEQAQEVMRRFRESLHEVGGTAALAPERGALTISGGLATYPWDAGSTRDLLDKADRALRQAKKEGKNRILLIGTERRPDAAQPTIDPSPA